MLSTCYFTVVVTPTFYDVEPKLLVRLIVNSLFIPFSLFEFFVRKEVVLFCIFCKFIKFSFHSHGFFNHILFFCCKKMTLPFSVQIDFQF